MEEELDRIKDYIKLSGHGDPATDRRVGGLLAAASYFVAEDSITRMFCEARKNKAISAELAAWIVFAQACRGLRSDVDAKRRS